MILRDLIKELVNWNLDSKVIVQINDQFTTDNFKIEPYSGVIEFIIAPSYKGSTPDFDSGRFGSVPNGATIC